MYSRRSGRNVLAERLWMSIHADDASPIGDVVVSIWARWGSLELSHVGRVGDIVGHCCYCEL